jgi:5-methylcytosine-specific restriction endonuclease McrA
MMRPKPVKKRRPRRALGHKRRAAKASGDLTEDQWARIVQAYGGMCAYCTVNAATQQDHVVSIARGGKHTAANCVPACSPCNFAKGTCGWEPKPGHPFRKEPS